MKTTTTTWIIIALIAVSGGLLFVSTLFRSAPHAGGEAAPLAADDYIRGATTSPVVLVEYLDFECGACGSYYPVIKQLEGEFGDRVTFVARYFPLQGHRNGLTAALAAEAAGRQGKFWEMHDLLFSRQKEWGNKAVQTPEVFEGYAAELGLNMEQYRADVASSEVRARVERDLTEGRAAGVNSTPSFYLNGQKIQNPASAEAFRQILQGAVDAAG